MSFYLQPFNLKFAARSGDDAQASTLGQDDDCQPDNRLPGHGAGHPRIAKLGTTKWITRATHIALSRRRAPRKGMFARNYRPDRIPPTWNQIDRGDHETRTKAAAEGR